MKVYDLTLTKSQQKGRVKPDFVLLPQDNRAPVIKSQPIRNFIQYTHFDKNNQPLSIAPTTTTVQLLKGTTFSFSVIVEDPANTLDPFDTSRLTFIWRLNGSEIYALSALNDGRGTPSVYLEAEYVDEGINGEYTVEVTNDYGTTISTPFSIEIIDKFAHPYLYKNLIKNDAGNKGLEDWTVSENVIVRQFMPKLAESENFASIYNLQGALKDPDGTTVEYEPEIPFSFASVGNWNNFSTFWDAVKKNNTQFIADRKWWLSQLPPNIIKNEYPYLSYGSFFPSPYWVDRVNNNNSIDGDGNVTIKKQGTLVESLNLTETYFTRDKIKFIKYGGKSQETMTQDIDITEIADVVDGRVPGVDKILAQFFAYVGIGISKYEYLFTFANGKSTRVNSTYFLDSKNIEKLFNGEQVTYLDIDMSLVVRVDIIPICYDTTTITLNFKNEKGVIGSTVIKGPDEYDAFAIKEKFLLSEQFTTLFSTALDLTRIRSAIPVFIFNQRYFQLIGLERGNVFTNKNRNWLKSNNYPKTSKAEKIKALVDPFDRGAAGMIGVGKDITIPSKTKTITVEIVYENTSQGVFDENPTIPSATGYVWDKEDVYGEHVSDFRRYEYNYPKTGITQIKLMLFPNAVNQHPTTQPTYILPKSQTLNSAKSDLYKDTHDSSNTVVYVDYGKTSTTDTGKDFRDREQKDATTGDQKTSEDIKNTTPLVSSSASTNTGGSGAGTKNTNNLRG